MYFARTPSLIRHFAGDLLWEVQTKDKEVFLTFDDGPNPGITEKVLDILDDYQAKATFFCLGKQATAHPGLFHTIQSRGHTTGHHTFSHPNGWRTNTYKYLRDAVKGAQAAPSPLFRPPYGQITRAQIRCLQKRYTLVMWSILSGDFDARISNEKCLSNVINHVRPGSIVVFHDSIKAGDKMLWILPRALDWLSKEGYSCRSLPTEK